MNHTREKRLQEMRRHKRVRAKIKGSHERPRLSVFRSGRHITVQLIDDVAGRTLAAASDGDVNAGAGAGAGGKNNAVSASVGALIAKRALEKKINQAVFDRGPYRYHGAVKTVADAARKGGLTL